MILWILWTALYQTWAFIISSWPLICFLVITLFRHHFSFPFRYCVRCLPTEQHHLCKERKRSRKPSPVRTKRFTSTEQLDQFLARGCGCATKCSAQFDRDFYLSKRDEASALTREQLDLVVLGQIQAFLSVDEVIGPSHKHTPTQRRTTRVNTFYHLGKKICRGSFLTLHGIGKIIILNN